MPYRPVNRKPQRCCALSVDLGASKPTLRPGFAHFSRGASWRIHPQKAASRPLSPHLGIYRWPVTMATSITHRITGVAPGRRHAAARLVAGRHLASGPEAYDFFNGIDGHAARPDRAVRLRLVARLSLPQRHPPSGLGLRLRLRAADRQPDGHHWSIALSLLLAVGVFAVAWTGHAGYLPMSSRNAPAQGRGPGLVAFRHRPFLAPARHRRRPDPAHRLVRGLACSVWSGTNEVSVLIFLSNPLNAVLMGSFVLISLYHMALGLQEVIVDYVPHEASSCS